MIRVLSRIKSEPWAITREAMDTILEIAQRENDSPQAVAARLGRPLDNTYDAEIRDGVAILSINGPLFRYANVFTIISGATSYDLLARDFAAALENPRVTSILLNIDSPGGEASGCSEFADMIYSARSRKTVAAYVGGSGCSAAYWLAAAAGEIVIADTAILGSIGVVLGITDTRARDEKTGVRYFEVVSAVSPYKRIDTNTDEGLARVQARVDALADVFVAKMATFRGTDTETVINNFGQGDVFVGQAAVQAGLADRVGSFEALVAELSSGTYRAPSGNSNAAAGGINQEDIMSDKTAPPAGEQKPTTAATDAPAPKVEAPPVAPAAAAPAVPPAVDQKARIKAIMTSDEAKGREDLASHLAYDTETGPEAAIAMLAKAPLVKPAASGFDKLDAAMKAGGNANVGADGDAAAGGSGDAAADALRSTAQAMKLAP